MLCKDSGGADELLYCALLFGLSMCAFKTNLMAAILEYFVVEVPNYGSFISFEAIIVEFGFLV